ncbi:hypothetical protein [Agromyces mariniharenae]|uniref:Uncharacterized protein n=1 Tax=Agromyces mariniharenae TaxID=2604423 RepID=A0A5S4V4T3_9MICO|nr:hypothetical protein [Agromyces mariniharenae]TYL54016.1 hypothetical protein FYC51_10490 [Agromyces mariniharenae]
MAGFRVRRRRGAQELEVHDADVAKRAGSALVAADERVRLAADELAFAEAELGSDATEGLAEAIVAARGLLGEAFRLNRTNHELTAGTPQEVQARDARIVLLCQQAEQVLDEHVGSLADGIGRARHAPEVIAGVRADVERLRSRLPLARGILDQLAMRYARSALAAVESNSAEAEQLLGFAEHSVGVAERRRAAGHREQANVALEASVDSVRRAAALLDEVEAFEVEALRAESQLAALVERARRNLAIAREEPASRPVATAVADLQGALADLPPAGVITDPFAHLKQLREANATLEAAIDAAHERATHPIVLVDHVRHAISHADRELDVARDAIAGHPGRIGAEALTRLAESERIRTDLGHYLSGFGETITVMDLDRRAQVIAMAQRAAFLAGESLLLARRDIDAFRSRNPKPRVGVDAHPSSTP